MPWYNAMKVFIFLILVVAGMLFLPNTCFTHSLSALPPLVATANRA